jgi:hypothetical protein
MKRFVSAANAVSGLALAALCAIAVPAGAVGVPATAHHVLSVKRCDPQFQAGTGGFTPAFYAGPRYRWTDVYGYPYLQPPIQPSGSLAIDYVNATSNTMTKIDFGLVANGRLVAEVRDVGTFSPGAEIQHTFGISPNAFPLGTALARCVPLRVTYKDGTIWRNPHLPALRRSIYAPPGR